MTNNGTADSSTQQGTTRSSLFASGRASRALSDMQRQNFEFWNGLTRLTAVSIQAIAQHQSGLLKRMIDEAGGVVRTSIRPQTPSECWTAQLELVERSFADASPRVLELSDLLARVQREACDLLGRHLTESARGVEHLLAVPTPE